MPLFDKDTDGTSKPRSLYIMGRRNWCCITLKQPSGDLLFDIRVEKEKGHGETVGYAVPRLGYIRFIVPLQVFCSGTSATMDSQGRQMNTSDFFAAGVVHVTPWPILTYL